MVKTGLEIILKKFPADLKGKNIGILCHAPSITPDFKHIIEHFQGSRDCRLKAIFGPQHGIYGQTQDNMIEWSGHLHPVYKIPVFSLYGAHRKPTSEMLDGIEAFIIDIQDIGARLYTYVWTVKLCMEACSEAGIPVWILDRPNPVGCLDFDGPVLKEEYFTFVGGAAIPLCHRMTAGEIALWVREKHLPGCDLRITRMEGWKRSMMFNETGLPWVLPSPNMPSLQTAVVYPGMVLLEALNLSEGRGTTIPFELFGAPFIDPVRLIKNLTGRKLPGCKFRIHDFIPTFNKYEGELCHGIQLHVTDLNTFRPVSAALEILEGVIQTTDSGSMVFNDPPYEYEYHLIPFDILAGDSNMRTTLLEGGSIYDEKERWADETIQFKEEFESVSLYAE